MYFTLEKQKRFKLVVISAVAITVTLIGFTFILLLESLAGIKDTNQGASLFLSIGVFFIDSIIYTYAWFAADKQKPIDNQNMQPVRVEVYLDDGWKPEIRDLGDLEDPETNVGSLNVTAKQLEMERNRLESHRESSESTRSLRIPQGVTSGKSVIVMPSCTAST
eukprot:CAMPEP_0115002126 /NCGR_PEP_ID=MMETSP0216-20121206/17817_1 /TAXON_ID=223996 /ORGANISM="Protocruzia adherens, Strain Boccale" /LENGTH=163 /DNA_ID=CAMNT_0002367655 /DNA_START=197 /DNA_END=688 /DNA_ORIENTATION=-